MRWVFSRQMVTDREGPGETQSILVLGGWGVGRGGEGLGVLVECVPAVESSLGAGSPSSTVSPSPSEAQLPSTIWSFFFCLFVFF